MIHTSYFIFIFIFGTLIGSFLNVVIIRYNTGRSILGLGGRLASPKRSGGGSFCPSCNKKLSWYELIPILSFIIQGGRCRTCKGKISWQYPLVEFITGLVFVAIFWKAQHLLFDSQFALFIIHNSYLMILFSLLIVIAAYDIRHKIIPNKLVWTFVILALFVPVFGLEIGAWDLFGNWKLGIGNLLAGPLLALPFALLWFFSKGRLMGLGDAKLILGIGFLLGLSKGVAALVLAFWIGAIISLLLILFSRLPRSFRVRSAFFSHLTMKSEIPFAPFLILSTFLAFLFDIDILSLISLFQL